MGNLASQTIKRDYTWDALSDKFLAFYEKRLNKQI